MKLSGIKVGSAEIERTLNALDGVLETAAVAVVPPGGGPSRLVVFAVLKPEARAAHRNWTATFRNAIRTRLNSMFKVHTVIVVDALPRTASNKVMRRLLRDQYRQILTAAEDGSEQ
jgi:acetyl-CoA synthetase